MTFGPVDQIRESTQRGKRTGSIVRFIWHHQASTNDDATINMMVTASRQVSATYTVNNDNYKGRGWSRITGVVPEQFRPWTSDSATADGRALTAEVCNSTGGPGWGIADTTHEACARIAAYAYQAYGVPLKRATADDLTGHMGHNEVVRFFGEGYPTFCPGHLDIDRVIARAVQLAGGNVPLGDGTPLPTTTEDDEKDDDMQMVILQDRNSGKQFKTDFDTVYMPLSSLESGLLVSAGAKVLLTDANGMDAVRQSVVAQQAAVK